MSNEFTFTLAENKERVCNNSGWISTDKHFAKTDDNYRCGHCRGTDTSRAPWDRKT